MRDTSDTTNRISGTAGAGLITLLLIQIIVGYEWLTSGITKVASGTFVSGLAADLKTNSDAAPQFYKTFLHGTVIPNAHLFAVLIEVGEILVGFAFIAAAILWLTRWSRLSDRWRASILATVGLAALGGILMAINFHLANGGNHPWLIPSDGFDETIDLDVVLAFIQAGYLGLCSYLLLKLRREHRPTSDTIGGRPGAIPARS